MANPLITFIIGTVVEHYSDKAEEEWEANPSTLGEKLDAFVGFLLALVVAGWFGLYSGSDFKGVGLEVIFLFIFWLFKFLLIAVVVTAIVCAVMGQIQGIGTKLAIYGGLVAFIAVISILGRLNDARKEHAAQARVEARDRSMESWKRERAETAERAAAAEAAEIAANEARRRDERETLIARYEQLSAAVPVRWREDLEASGATGAPGVIPPMLKLKQVGGPMWKVTNLGDKPVCVSVGRVIGSAGNWRRCPADAEMSCREIGRKASRQILLREINEVPACVKGQLEFRVGTPSSPEPSWWTRSALEEFDTRGVDEGLRPHQLSIDHLRGEVALFESMLADKNRAARWRSELGGPES